METEKLYVNWEKAHDLRQGCDKWNGKLNMTTYCKRAGIALSV